MNIIPATEMYRQLESILSDIKLSIAYSFSVFKLRALGKEKEIQKMRVRFVITQL